MDRDTEIQFQVRENKMVLLAGLFTIGFTLFVLVMGLRYPAQNGNRIVFYGAILVMLAVGSMVCMKFFCRKVMVKEMNMCYVNSFGRKKEFTLDNIGYCKLEFGNNQYYLRLYDLLGCKLCKLEFAMSGCIEFLQYLVDNKVKMEWTAGKSEFYEASLLAAMLRETSVCEEEIQKCAENLYERVQELFREWEKENKRFAVSWEFGYGEYEDGDFLEKGALWERRSSVNPPLAQLPESYVCLLEAYLKKDGEYVIDKKGKEVSVFVPYLVRGRSYQIGEQIRIRKMDEQEIVNRLKRHLIMLAQTLPRNKYHTEQLVMAHELRKTAGVAYCDYQGVSTVLCADATIAFRKTLQ